jgi:hypothetical protein
MDGAAVGGDVIVGCVGANETRGGPLFVVTNSPPDATKALYTNCSFSF